ncbi:MAG TPA: alpha/beta fold hydrolase [Vicinamibacterales bacterium]|nr:alpha/beta fold hydrolase [Vicinamibacterales bacterium]
MRKPSSTFAALACVAAAIAAGSHRLAAAADDASKILTIDHHVRLTSKVPSIAGQQTTVYVREKVRAGNALRGATASDKVVVFIHGAGTPAEVAFDVPYKDYSWMEYLAEAGFDTFAMDVTGIGRSARPWPMNDPCNLAPAQQAALIPALLAAPCAAGYAKTITTIANDWDDIDAVVNYVRALRRVDKVSTVAWSLGGPRSGGYAAQHPEKISRQVMLAPAYNAQGPAGPPTAPAASPVPFNTQSRADFNANWLRQTGCADQWTEDVHDVVWSEMLASDPVGATWGTGVRRAPNTPSWGWNQAVVAKTQIPLLMVAGIHDGQVPPDRVRQLYTDHGAREKVFIDLGCSSHNAMWEKNHLILFKASLEWLSAGSVNGQKEGMLKLGY